jgi:murein hydrolase activator
MASRCSNVDTAALKGCAAYSKAALKGCATYSTAALKGCATCSQAALKGCATYSQAALKGCATAVATLVLVAQPFRAATQPQPPPSASQRIAERISALQREADALASQEQTLIGELRKLDIDRQIKVAELARIDDELKQTHSQLDATVQRAAALRDAAETERPDVEARLVQLYKMGRAGYWRLLLDVDDARSIGRAYRTASALTRIDRDRVQQHQRTLESLAQERASLEARARQVGALQEKAVAARAAVDRAVAARTALVASIDRRRDLNAQLTGELQAAQQRLSASVEKLGGARPIVQVPIKPFRGALPWPVSGIVISRFGAQRGGAARNGVEISIAEGRPVRPVHEGTVAFADQFAGYANLVILDHGDNAFTLYGYLDSLDVKRGDTVDPQTRLGASGRNPSGNPALYFELRIDAKPVDPLQWLKK